MEDRVYSPGEGELEAIGNRADTFENFEGSSAFDIKLLAGPASLEILSAQVDQLSDVKFNGFSFAVSVMLHEGCAFF